MSGNICRCAAYPNIRAAIRAGPRRAGGRMRPLTLQPGRPASTTRVALVAAEPGERVPRRRHDRGRPDPRRDLALRPPRRHQRPPARRRRGPARRRAAHRRARADERRGARHPRVVERYPGDLAGAAARRLGAAAQHGLDGRQPAPAHALRVPARRHLAVQQARARARAARRSTGSTAGTRSSARASTASPRIRRTSRSRSSRSTPSSTPSARDGERAIADRRLLPAAGRHARASSTRSRTAS